MYYPFGSKKFKKQYILLLLCNSMYTANAIAEQQSLNIIPKSSASNAITVIRESINTELTKQQEMNTELYSLTSSGLPPCNDVGDIRQWDGNSWECASIIDFLATSPLSFNSTTGVLSLTPWASQSALETWLGWTFSGNGGGITVSTALPTVSGSATLNDSTHVLTVASDTGYTQFTGVFTAWDTAPDAFGFGTITDAVSGQEYCWTTPVTVAGIDRNATVSSTAHSYKINGITSTATSIAVGDTFTPCMTASSTAGATVSGNMTVGGVVGSPAFSVVTRGINEGFEGEGLPISWVSTGTPDYDCSTGNCPIVNTQSLSVSYGQAAKSVAISTLPNSNAEFIVKFTASTNVFDVIFAEILDASDNALSKIVIRGDNTLRVYNGTALYTSSFKFLDNTAYHMWIDYTAGSGSNGVLYVYITQYTGSEKKPDIATCSITTGTSTSSGSKIQLGHLNYEAGGNIIFDQVKYQ